MYTQTLRIRTKRGTAVTTNNTQKGFSSLCVVLQRKFRQVFMPHQCTLYSRAQLFLDENLSVVCSFMFSYFTPSMERRRKISAALYGVGGFNCQFYPISQWLLISERSDLLVLKDFEIRKEKPRFSANFHLICGFKRSSLVRPHLFFDKQWRRIFACASKREAFKCKFCPRSFKPPSKKN